MSTPAPAIPRTFADAEVILAETLPGYSPRPAQQRAARAVEVAIANGRHLLVEAPTATGKTLLTGIPAILSGVMAGRRVVISTATKALQSQVIDKDLPFLSEALPVDFTYAMLKGRSNYLCRSAAMGTAASDVVALPEVMERITETDWDGTQETLGVTLNPGDWARLTVSSDECPGKKICPFGDSCYAEMAKNRAQEADIVVVNHALLLTELVIRKLTAGNGSMLGDFDLVIADEAHEIREYAVGAFTEQVSKGGVERLCSEVEKFVATHGMEEAFGDASTKLRDAFTALWIADTVTEEGVRLKAIQDGRIRPSAILAFEDDWIGAANAVYDCYEAFRTAPLLVKDTEEERARKYKLTARLRSVSETLVSIISGDDDKVVRWIETENRGRFERQVIKIAPIDIAPYLKELLFDAAQTILVSATMAVDAKMDFIANDLGVGDYDSLIVESPFDYTQQARLYVPSARVFPSPAPKSRSEWEGMVPLEMLDLVRSSRGRALLLFTSTKQMRDVHAAIADRIEMDYPVFMQGESMSNLELIKAFQSQVDSVLFATRSFFTGVDIPGEALSLVVIDKLPFPVPTEPMFEARAELVRARGGNDFSDLTIPMMTLTLAQGFGRLIRRVDDKGVVAILDHRLVSSGYGKKILRSLPNAPLISATSEVASFLG